MQSSASSCFQFGSVLDTYYEKVNIPQSYVLPYNPFSFDCQLQLIHAPLKHEPKYTFFPIQPNSIHIFGRRRKRQPDKNNGIQIGEKDRLSTKQVCYELKAATFSQRHFTITKDQILKDMGSKHGTFVWISKNNHKIIEVTDSYLIGKHLYKVKELKSNSHITLESEGKQIIISKKWKNYLFGSSNQCQHIVQGLRDFHVAINMEKISIMNLIEDQDCKIDNGVWVKVLNGVKIKGDDMILAGPYIFKVSL